LSEQITTCTITTYRFTPQPNTGPSELWSILQAGKSQNLRAKNDCDQSESDALTKLSDLLSKTPLKPEVASIAVAKTEEKYESDVLPLVAGLGILVENEHAPACSKLFPQYEKIRPTLERFAGAHKNGHNIDGTVSISPGFDVKVSVIEKTFDTKTPTDASPQEFKFSPQNNAVTLSAGIGLTWLQSRSYTATTVPDPATSASATKSVLVVGDTGAPRPVLLALLNYHLLSLSKDFTLAVSAGPVLQTGGKSDLATLGAFAGLSFSLMHNLYTTPGVHIGQYANPPAGLAAGQTIPSGLGNITPVKSYEPNFALGITFRSNRLKAGKVDVEKSK
jgi:hypothetical protein